MIFHPLYAGAMVSADHVSHIINGLKDHTLPKNEWTHGAHLTAAAALLGEAGLERALAEMPDMIRRYNEATGVKNTDTEGYHQTITVVYLHVINDFCGYLAKPVHDRATALLASPLAARDYVLQFYSKALLFSKDARRDFVTPDIKRFPGQP